MSNIWHLATVDIPDKDDYSSLGTLSDLDIENLRLYTYDLEQLETRFKGFEAPSYFGKHEIVSGIERIMDDPTVMSTKEVVPLKDKVAKLRTTTKKLSTDRERIRQWWNDSLYLGYGHNRQMSLSMGVQVPQMTTKSLLYTGYKYTVIAFLTTTLFAYFYLLNPDSVLILTVLLLVLMVVFFGVTGLKYLKTGTVEGILKQVAIVVLETMSGQGPLKSSIKNVGLHVMDDKGRYYVSCTNLPTEENNLFIQALQELLDPIENPRYLLVHHSKFLGRIK